MNKEKAKKVFSLSKQEILYLFIIIMLGISIFFIQSLIDPLHNLGDELAENQEVAIGLAKRIMEQQDIIIEKKNQHENQTIRQYVKGYVLDEHTGTIASLD